jgi:hypothetical protein
MRITVALPGDWGDGSTPITDAIVRDRFGAEWEIEGYDPGDSIPVLSGHGTAYYYTKGKSEKVFLVWNIGTLYPGETAELIFEISTDLNPAGKQEYTSCGCYELNSGAVLKFMFGSQYSVYSGPITVSVS